MKKYHWERERKGRKAPFKNQESDHESNLNSSLHSSKSQERIEAENQKQLIIELNEIRKCIVARNLSKMENVKRKTMTKKNSDVNTKKEKMKYGKKWPIFHKKNSIENR